MIAAAGTVTGPGNSITESRMAVSDAGESIIGDELVILGRVMDCGVTNGDWGSSALGTAESGAGKFPSLRCFLA